jgi:hypothetical protein
MLIVLILENEVSVKPKKTGEVAPAGNNYESLFLVDR